MRVAVSGASGLVGSAVAQALGEDGHRVVRLVRDRARTGDEAIYWDWTRGEIDAAGFRGTDAVVHLAGRNIGRRWNAGLRREMWDSRIEGTRLVAQTLAASGQPPRLLINASAIGYYGDRGDEPLDESSPAGRGWLSEMCLAWEAATLPAARAGIRVARLRIGVVLTPRGGALARMLTPFRLGLGGRLGDGRQVMSWICLHDLVRAVRFLLEDPAADGPFNAVAPQPVTNAEFTRTLAEVLRRPAILPVPAFAIRALWGEMGESLLLAGARVLPAALTDRGFAFEHPELASALRFELAAG